MTENRVPAYCRICGSKLRTNESVSGFDPYTGEPVSESELYCANPTVKTVKNGFGRVTTQAVTHPTWFILDGEWVSS